MPSSHRPAWAEISTSALRSNVRALKSVLGATSLCGVVKANGYGHGVQLVARTVLEAGAHSLAVATVDEGVELREAGLKAPILLLAEVSSSALPDALASSLTLTVGSLGGARDVLEVAKNVTGVHRVHLKVDTGMHRMGVGPGDVAAVLEVLAGSTHVDVEGIYTHFNVADGSSADDRGFTHHQIEVFDEVVAATGPDRRPRVVHLANSAGALGYEQARRDMARVGLALYGYLPAPWLAGALEEQHVTLSPVMTLRAKVVASRRVGAGERPSYGRRRALAKDSNIVTVPFGYADGYPRRLFEAGAEVLINGRRYPLAGTVTMDQLLVDVGDDEVVVGDEVVLLGRQGDERISADEWARRAGTISWEVLCGVGARVPRVLVD
ncbi:MAG: alanine racemase [Acidimicrobiales bacterium]